MCFSIKLYIFAILNLNIVSKKILGIDIGGTGIKGSIVDVTTGEVVSERVRILTPKPATPVAVAEKVKELVDQLNWKGDIGCGFPAVVMDGIVKTASNIDKAWIGVDIQQLLGQYTGCKVSVVNDADAAGMAEIHFGKPEFKNGVVVLLTIGTGIGSSVFVNGALVPNTELGFARMHGMIAEKYASNVVRKKQDLSWKVWGKRLNEYLKYIEEMIWPDVILIGGGVSKKMAEFQKHLKLKAKVMPATMKNVAGVVGAAMCAMDE